MTTSPPNPARASAWLSTGFEQLAARLPVQPGRGHLDVDVLVIGSGYGGAMVAATLAGADKPDGSAATLWVLERGKEYLPGAFPARMANLTGHTRFSTSRGGPPQGNREGLFDLRIGPDVNALVANGLGGGSLINAGVMATPSAAQLADFPPDYAALNFTRASSMLGGSNTAGAPNTILSRAPGHAPPAKYRALVNLGQGMGLPVTAAPISVAMQTKDNNAGVGLNACIMCGDCATGCNHNAKDSLDTNLLVTAKRQGAALFTGATVLRLTHEAAEPDLPERWCAHVVFTDPVLRKKQKHPARIYCAKLVLAAGTFGSTEILLRSRSETLEFSPLLGQKFSSNGDMIMVAYQQAARANAVANEEHEPAARAIGPTITGMLQAGGILIEELAVPGPLRRMFEELVTTAYTLHTLAHPDTDAHVADGTLPDPCAVDPAAIEHSTVLALMGDDGAEGSLELVGDAGAEQEGDGALRVRWPGLREAKLFQDQLALLKDYAANNPGAGAILPNPMWKLLPAELEYLLANRFGPPMTVHPLGGCPMGADRASGVVNMLGQVFIGAPGPGALDGLHHSLVVLDGSVVPKALGVNPALTIAAIALRAAEGLRDEWGWRAPAEVTRTERRPVFQIMPAPKKAAPTVAEFVERMSGPLKLETKTGRMRDCMVELTMQYDPTPLAALVLPQSRQPVGLKRRLTLTKEAHVHVYDAAEWHAWKLLQDNTLRERPQPLLSAQLGGTLDFFQREPSRRWGRTWRAFVPWLLNRGMRDTWQWAEERIREGGFFSSRSSGLGPWEDVKRRFRIALALASRAGEVRLFEYDLTMGAIIASHPDFALANFARPAIHGLKRITYGRASNPWKQLTRLTLDAFPSMAADSPRLLQLDTGFLVKEDIALLRIREQQDQPSALADVAGMGGYLLRLLLTVHIWSFRKPDQAAQRSAQRLPGSIRGLPEPRIRELEVGLLPSGQPVFARLTRYKRDDMPHALSPVMMIHGYSASGTSFAHPAVDPNLASHLWEQGHDVWILDLRTSSGMPTARHPWTFEDAAHADIPAAIDHIYRAFDGKKRVDIVAHCMGAAMFGMAVLAPPESGAPFFNERQAMPGRIGKVVLSQVGPLVVFSQANIFRAYLMGYLNQVLPMEGYTFRVEGEPTLADELLDRMLATLPYPDNEFHLENPVWPWRRTPFTGTRHRMDALYGRDFSLGNIGKEVLDNIDDFFGPLSIDTVSQAMHLARQKTICNRAGRNTYVSRRQLLERWIFETLSVHGKDNGLADVATLGRMRAVFADAKMAAPLHVQAFDNFGHQDCLIGRASIEVHAAIGIFLAGKRPAAQQDDSTLAPPATPLLARIPHSGPVRSSFASIVGSRPVSEVGCVATPVLPDALLVAFVPVSEKNGRFELAGTPHVSGPLPAETELYIAAVDEAGFMTFTHGPAPANADGMLMLILYDTSALMLGGDYIPSDPLKDRRLKGYDLMQIFQLLLAATPAATSPTSPPPAPREFLSLVQAVVDKLSALSEHVALAIGAELARLPANELRRGLVPVNRHDICAGGERPVGADGSICFALGSCQYPAGILDQVPAFASYRRLAALLDNPKGRPTPEFLVLMGDQIYADATAGLFDPADSDDRYVRPYEKLFSTKEVQSVLRRLPAFMMLDDHEISDNWERDADDLAPDDYWTDGRRGYLNYQRNAPPPQKRQLWSKFNVNGIHFFMADTRSERRARTLQSGPEAHIMSDEQWHELRSWLEHQHEHEPKGKPRFIVTPSILAPCRLRSHTGAASARRIDAWEGYPASRDRLLALIAELGLCNVVFLSGDEHLSIDARITIRSEGRADTVIRSIHSSALYAPYPFANAIEADFEDQGNGFDIRDPVQVGRVLNCSVESRYHQGDGFAVLTVEQEAPETWRLDCRFDREP